MPVRVIITSRIANPIVLDVVPLTVEMANFSLLAAEIPTFNPFSPPYAGNLSICFNLIIISLIMIINKYYFSTRFG